MVRLRTECRFTTGPRCRGRRSGRCRDSDCRHPAAWRDRGAWTAPAARHRYRDRRRDGPCRRRTPVAAWLSTSCCFRRCRSRRRRLPRRSPGRSTRPAAATTAIIAGVARQRRRATACRMTVIANAHHDPAHVAAIRAAVPRSGEGATVVFPDLTRRRWASRLTDEFQSGACHAGRYEGVDCAVGGRPIWSTSRGCAALPPTRIRSSRRSRAATAPSPPRAGRTPISAGRPMRRPKKGGQIIGALGAILEEAVIERSRTERRTTELGMSNDERQRRASRTTESRNEGRATRGLRSSTRTTLGRRGGSRTAWWRRPGGRSCMSRARRRRSRGRCVGEPFVRSVRARAGEGAAVVRASGGDAGDVVRMTMYRDRSRRLSCRAARRSPTCGGGTWVVTIRRWRSSRSRASSIAARSSRIEADAAVPPQDTIMKQPTSFALSGTMVRPAVATITLDRPDRLERADLPGLRGAARSVSRRWAPSLASAPWSSPAPAGPSAPAATCTTSSARCCRATIAACSSSRGSLAIWCSSIRRCPRPVIAALNGTAAGAGAVIATACDVRIAAASARIAFLFTKVGLAGADMGAAWLLPRLIGLGRATELLMTGDFIAADEAHRIGLVQSCGARRRAR